LVIFLIQRQDAVATSLYDSLLNAVAISDCHNGDWKSPLQYWVMYSGKAIIQIVFTGTIS